MRRSDSEIKAAVLRELAWDTRVDETGVGVEVDAGVVTLSGAVGSWAKKTAALHAARRVAGVLDVANDVLVKIPGIGIPSDTEVAHAVRTALSWDVLVPDAHIRSTVANHWVSLDGAVDSWAEREDAERAVRNLKGVRGISNRIEVVPPEMAAEAVRAAVAGALERHAQREAQRVLLEVKDGSVSLTGGVDSWSERQAIVDAVKGTRGVRRVEDHLRIEP